MFPQNDRDLTPAQKTTLQRAMDELGPRLQELRNLMHINIVNRAEREGWSKSQAEWLDSFAEVPFLEAILSNVPAPEALDNAYTQARSQLAEAYFIKALDDGKNRLTAFLTVIDLERQVVERRGEPVIDYSDAWLQRAAAAVEAAAAAGVSPHEQLVAGFATLHELAMN
ncbi:hypothetical protein [Microvirga sp. 2TAF3]|uniref:hypothetical protein n=1 Tax=Microvirga sp. 2TAF3 TaxID=3233014 RepID=UPI003F9AA1C7